MEIRHYEDSVIIPASPRQVFEYVDDHSHFSSHMSKPSLMTGGGRMDVQTDAGHGQTIGSHIRLSGKVFGTNLFLDEVITKYEPPHHKEWQTVGNLRLLAIGHYRMGLEINPGNEDSRLRVFIDYELPKSLSQRLLGYLFGRMYAKWCVKQIISTVQAAFTQRRGPEAK